LQYETQNLQFKTEAVGMDGAGNWQTVLPIGRQIPKANGQKGGILPMGSRVTMMTMWASPSDMPLKGDECMIVK
jgi:hypothetical protein